VEPPPAGPGVVVPEPGVVPGASAAPVDPGGAEPPAVPEPPTRLRCVRAARFRWAHCLCLWCRLPTAWIVRQWQSPQ